MERIWNTSADTVMDMVGEPVDLENCPECREHLDCFSNIEGKCTALKSNGGEGCVFYCNKEKAIIATKAAYRRLKESGRYDIIQKYIKSLTALGAFDDEINDIDRVSQELDNFRDADLERLRKENAVNAEITI